MIFSLASAQSAFIFTRDLQFGDRNNDVLELQKTLNRDIDTRVAETSYGSPGMETTFFGNLTLGAVNRFQDKFRNEILLPLNLFAPTGYVGPSTRSKLNQLNQDFSLLGQPVTTAPSPTTTTTQVFPTTDLSQRPILSRQAEQDLFDEFLSRDFYHTAIRPELSPGRFINVAVADRNTSVPVGFRANRIDIFDGTKVSVIGDNFLQAFDLYLGNVLVFKRVLTDENLYFEAPANGQVGQNRLSFVQDGVAVSNDLIFNYFDKDLLPTITDVEVINNVTLNLTGKNFESFNQVETLLGSISNVSSFDGTSFSISLNDLQSPFTEDPGVRYVTIPFWIKVTNNNGPGERFYFALTLEYPDATNDPIAVEADPNVQIGSVSEGVPETQEELDARFEAEAQAEEIGESGGNEFAQNAPPLLTNSQEIIDRIDNELIMPEEEDATPAAQFNNSLDIAEDIHQLPVRSINETEAQIRDTLGVGGFVGDVADAHAEGLEFISEGAFAVVTLVPAALGAVAEGIEDLGGPIGDLANIHATVVSTIVSTVVDFLDTITFGLFSSIFGGLFGDDPTARDVLKGAGLENAGCLIKDSDARKDKDRGHLKSEENGGDAGGEGAEGEGASEEGVGETTYFGGSVLIGLPCTCSGTGSFVVMIDYTGNSDGVGQEEGSGRSEEEEDDGCPDTGGQPLILGVEEGSSQIFDYRNYYTPGNAILGSYTRDTSMTCEFYIGSCVEIPLTGAINDDPGAGTSMIPSYDVSGFFKSSDEGGGEGGGEGGE